MRIARFLAAFLLSAAFPVTAALAAPQYAVTPLGSLGSQGMAINNRGQIVGFIVAPEGDCHAFLYDGTIHDLGDFGGTYSEATAINDNGQIAGRYYSPGDQQHQHALLIDHGAMQDLGPSFAFAHAINDSGQIVGYSSGWNAALYHGALYDLGRFGGYGSDALGINASGQVVGTSWTYSEADGATVHAFLYYDGVMHDLGAFGHLSSEATAINASGQIVGSVSDSTSESRRAYLYDGTFHDLGTLPFYASSSAVSINAGGQIAGNLDNGIHFPEDNDKFPPNHGFIYDGTMHDLNDLIDPTGGWVINEVDAINDNGWIVAQAYNDSYSGAVLLTPVPEPGSALLVVACAGLLVARRRGKRNEYIDWCGRRAGADRRLPALRLRSARRPRRRRLPRVRGARRPVAGGRGACG